MKRAIRDDSVHVYQWVFLSIYPWKDEIQKEYSDMETNGWCKLKSDNKNMAKFASQQVIYLRFELTP